MFEISQIEARVADHRRDVARADLAAQLPVRPALRARASSLGGRAVTRLASVRSGEWPWSTHRAVEGLLELETAASEAVPAVAVRNSMSPAGVDNVRLRARLR